MRLEGDCAIIRQKGQTLALTAPLHVKGQTSTRAGQVDHDTIIGKQPRDVIISSKNRELRVHIPTLEEYVVMTPRFVVSNSRAPNRRRGILTRKSSQTPVGTL